MVKALLPVLSLETNDRTAMLAALTKGVRRSKPGSAVYNAIRNPQTLSPKFFAFAFRRLLRKVLLIVSSSAGEFARLSIFACLNQRWHRQSV